MSFMSAMGKHLINRNLQVADRYLIELDYVTNGEG